MSLFKMSHIIWMYLVFEFQNDYNNTVQKNFFNFQTNFGVCFFAGSEHFILPPEI